MPDNGGRRGRRSVTSGVLALIVAASMTLVACSDDDEQITSPQRAHGGQSINIAVLRSPEGVMVAGGNGLVSATEDPSFTFAPGAVLEAGASYEVHYWIDSNFGVGTPGACDDKGIDHQWRVELESVSGDVAFTAGHDPSQTEDVCSTFS